MENVIGTVMRSGTEIENEIGNILDHDRKLNRILKKKQSLILVYALHNRRCPNEDQETRRSVLILELRAGPGSDSTMEPELISRAGP
ncbi:hypothetical protein EVAR_47630_1 [Eumeta japonica]|uniref:Uncharacterized protein n=1 Tax=Eumeta variegata TaxID=151549 RepID=A0A4C1ZDK6_EUMVA|nr:hypothetical protein EVAR_47630_1 [Eumeta japonica]